MSINSVINRARERRVQPYWETHNLAATAVPDQAFFAAVPTTYTGRPGAVATISGNMQTAGQFPAPRQYWVRGISVKFDTSVAATAQLDAAILSTGCLVLTIADKEYLRLMTWMAPGGGGMSNNGAPATAAGIDNGQPLSYNYFKVDPAIRIPPQQNFRVNITSFVATALTTISFLTVVLWGIEERAVQ